MLSVPNELLNFLIIFAGVTWRTIRPWLKKYKSYADACEEAEEEGKPVPDPKTFGLKKQRVKFKKRFLFSAGCSLLSILVISAMVGALQSPTVQTGFPLFMWAIGQTEVINREIL